MTTGTGLFMLSIASSLILMGSGYCYGKAIQRYCTALNRFSCTCLGAFTILGLFQIWIYFSNSFNLNTRYSMYLAALLILIGPVLAFFAKADLRPKKYDYYAWLTALICVIVLCNGSARLNLNSIYYDSITYLSETLESSRSDQFAHMIFDRGVPTARFDPLHDFTAYYYFWGMILRILRGVTHIGTSLTPVYIWCGTLFYAIALGDLIWNSISLFYKKNPWRIYLIALLIIAPHYSDPFSTTLAFFGNALRTITGGWSIFLAYLIASKHDYRLFLPLTITYYMSLCATSSGMFLSAFNAAVLAFSLALFRETDQKVWKGFVLSLAPIVHYAMIYVFSSRYEQYFLIMGLTFGIVGFLWMIAHLIRNHLEGFDRFLSFCLPVAIAGLIAGSVLFFNQEYPMSEYFLESGNYFIPMTAAEGVRSIVWLILFGCMFLNFQKYRKMKIMILLFFALFLNPLVMPAVEKFFTSYVYIRAFDLVISPPVMVFMIFSFDKLISGKILNIELKSMLAAVSCVLLLINIMDSNNGPLRYKEPGWDWKLKVSPDSYALYQYVQDNISSDTGERLSIMSQDINLKGYVTGIEISFCSTEFREVLGNPEAYTDKLDLVRLLYPSSHYAGQILLGQEIDYSKLPDLIKEYNPDYLVVSNQTAVWNSRGWYDRIYVRLETDGLAKMEYQNDTWSLLKINHDDQGQEG